MGVYFEISPLIWGDYLKFPSCVGVGYLMFSPSFHFYLRFSVVIYGADDL